MKEETVQLHDIQTPIVAANHSMKVVVVGDVFCSTNWVQEAVAGESSASGLFEVWW